MLSRLRSSRGRPINAPASFIHPCQPTVASNPPSGQCWAHELKHDGYRLQIHIRDGRVRLYTMNGADWSKRYPLIIQDAARVKGSAILDAEAVWLDPNGVADFEALHGRSNDDEATACAFDLRCSTTCGANPTLSARPPFENFCAVIADTVCGARRGARRKAFYGCLQTWA